MEPKRHIAQSGKSAGKWVSCTAKNQCRVGGTHITGGVLHVARDYHGYASGQWTSLATVPEQAVLDWQNLSPEKKEEFRTHLREQREKATAKKAAADAEEGRAAVAAVIATQQVASHQYKRARAASLVKLGARLSSAEYNVLRGIEPKVAVKSVHEAYRNGGWSKEERKALENFVSVRVLCADVTAMASFSRSPSTAFILAEYTASQALFNRYGFGSRSNSAVTNADMENAPRFVEALRKIQDSSGRRRFEALSAADKAKEIARKHPAKSSPSATPETAPSAEKTGVRAVASRLARTVFKRVSGFKVTEF